MTILYIHIALGSMYLCIFVCMFETYLLWNGWTDLKNSLTNISQKHYLHGSLGIWWPHNVGENLLSEAFFPGMRHIQSISWLWIQIFSLVTDRWRFFGLKSSFLNFEPFSPPLNLLQNQKKKLWLFFRYIGTTKSQWAVKKSLHAETGQVNE